MKLYLKNFEIYHNISIYLFYFIFLERPRSPWEVHAEPLGLRGAGSACGALRAPRSTGWEPLP